MTTLKEHGVLFSDPMVQAILRGRKDQTRRIVTPQPWKNGLRDGQPLYFWKHGKEGDFIHADATTVAKLIETLNPIKAGDTLWVREAAKLSSVGPGPREVSVAYRASSKWADPHGGPNMIEDYGDGAAQPYTLTRWTPGMYMPRWACRIRLQVLMVGAERLHDLSEAGARREGIYEVEDKPARYGYDGNAAFFSPVSAYTALWEGLNAERGYSWKANPWVVVYTFRVIAAER